MCRDKLSYKPYIFLHIVTLTSPFPKINRSADLARDSFRYTLLVGGGGALFLYSYQGKFGFIFVLNDNVKFISGIIFFTIFIFLEINEKIVKLKRFHGLGVIESNTLKPSNS